MSYSVIVPDNPFVDLMHHHSAKCSDAVSLRVMEYIFYQYAQSLNSGSLVDGCVPISIMELVEELNISEASVKRALRTLKDKNILVGQSVYLRGQRQSNIYRPANTLGTLNNTYQQYRQTFNDATVLSFIDEEAEGYYTEQIVTYLGNKRALLGWIEDVVLDIERRLGLDKLRCADLLSGSGIVARMLKRHSDLLITNDISCYTKVINDCFLSNKSRFNEDEFLYYHKILSEALQSPVEGHISRHYAPQSNSEITENDRVFFSRENALRIDTIRLVADTFPAHIQPFFLAPLLAEASVHANTAGHFNSYYKSKRTGIGMFGGDAEDARGRILAPISIQHPILSYHECEVINYQRDANDLVRELPPLDLVYIDPPYNAHSYAANYHILDLICTNEMPRDISPTSGIPTNLPSSPYNRKSQALPVLEDLVAHCDARYIVISYNEEGFISLEEMTAMLEKYGKLEIRDSKRASFRGGRNQSQRKTSVTEYLFVLRKNLIHP